MKRILLTLIILFCSISFIRAQEDLNQLTYEPEEQFEDAIQTENEKEKSVISKNQYFEIEIVRGIQSPITKKIPFTLYITPKIDSPKTQILWNVPTVFTLEQNHREFVSLEKDQTYTFTASVKPDKEGTYDISVNVISWQFDTNKSNSASYNLTLNSSFVVQPTDSQYSLLVLLLVLGILLGSGLFTFLLIKSVKILVRKAKTWLTPPL